MVKKVTCDLTGIEDILTMFEIFAIAAKDAGWKERRIERVCNEAMRGDFDHFRETIRKYCK